MPSPFKSFFLGGGGRVLFVSCVRAHIPELDTIAYKWGSEANFRDSVLSFHDGIGGLSSCHQVMTNTGLFY